MASKHQHYEQNHQLRIVLVGKTGAGKSATGNTILGPKTFKSKFGAKSVTIESTKEEGLVDGQKVAVIDTPGLFDTRYDKDKTNKDIATCIAYSSPGPHVFLVLIRLGRFTEEEMNTVQNIQEIFGQAANQYSMVLFTGGDELETTSDEFLAESLELQELVARCNGQYHVFNNKVKDPSQVTELLKKISNIVQKNGGSHYTNDMFQEAERQLQEEAQRILKEKEEQIQKEKEELEKIIRAKYEEKMLKIQAEREKEIEKEKKEREEERKKSKLKLDEVIKREGIKREAELKERMVQERKMKEEMEAKLQRELSEAKANIQAKHEKEAREKAEKKAWKCSIL